MDEFQVPENLLPSEEDVRFYEEHGWFRTPKVLSDELIDSAVAGLEEHWSGHRDAKLPVQTGYGDWMPGAGSGTRNNEYLSLQNNRVRRLALSPVIGAIAAKLARTEEIRLFDDQMVYKPAGQGLSAVGWHVDGDYWGTCASQSMLTAWIPLHDCPEELGPCAMLDGSHKWSHLVDREILSFNRQDMEQLQRHVESLGFSFQPVPMSMERGQMSFHHTRTLHGSYPNRGERPRIAYAVHLQDASNRYRSAANPDGSPVRLFNDLICAKDGAGLPDYADDEVFPALWRHPDFAERSLQS